jgi:hypothetical protein
MSVGWVRLKMRNYLTADRGMFNVSRKCLDWPKLRLTPSFPTSRTVDDKFAYISGWSTGRKWLCDLQQEVSRISVVFPAARDASFKMDGWQFYVFTELGLLPVSQAPPAFDHEGRR